MRRLKFIFDPYNWYIPCSIHLKCVGNNHRPYCLVFGLLCFALIICIDEDSLVSGLKEKE
jgi:hypothetical protein